MPANCVSVTRPGKWGNPFRIGWRYKIGKPTNGGVGWVWLTCYDRDEPGYRLCDSPATAVAMFREMMTNHPPKDIGELRGKDLACFCPLDSCCHADVLLEILERTTP